ncbi:MAG TPA: zinc ribbon domain-containing protein [candidate division Zixibacteria bacterium]|nr:zinc ribbon domain-containing protein [candidate division Zixibacteria bacterium]
MPLYKYECESCGNQFEELVSASAPPPPCPKCGSEKVHKMLSLVASPSGGSDSGSGSGGSRCSSGFS